jgi:hypothetical protein
MQTHFKASGFAAWLAIAVLGAMPSQPGCSSQGGAEVTDAGDDGASEQASSTKLGTSYACPAQNAPSTVTCVVGKSYCEFYTGGGQGGAPGSDGGPGGASGSLPAAPGSCVAIPQGTSCAAHPSCACLCPGSNCGICTCRDNNGLVEFTCLAA